MFESTLSAIDAVKPTTGTLIQDTDQSRPPAPQLSMQDTQPNNPLHGITLETLLKQLVTSYGWDVLSRHVDIGCFTNDPSIASSLKFLRRTPWARERVESLYLEMLADTTKQQDT